MDAPITHPGETRARPYCPNADPRQTNAAVGAAASGEQGAKQSGRQHSTIAPPNSHALRAEWAAYYKKLGMVLCAIPPGTKGPTMEGWPEHNLGPEHWEAHPGDGIGIVLGPSRLASFDLDALTESRALLGGLGLDLDSLMAGACLVRGNPARLRALFRAPSGGDLKTRKLVWPPRDPTKPKDHPEGKPVTVFELRAGPVQDVLPPTLHPGTGKPYTWDRAPWELDGRLADLPPELLELWTGWDSWKPALEAMCPWAKPPEPKPQARTPGSGLSVIAAFNQAHDVCELLRAHGYKPKGKSRLVAPCSESKLPGVVMLPESGRIYSHHAADPLATGHALDAFEVYAILEHRGDTRAAVKAAVKALGMGRGPARRGDGDPGPWATAGDNFQRGPGDSGDRGDSPCESNGKGWATGGRLGATIAGPNDSEGPSDGQDAHPDRKAELLARARRALKPDAPQVPDYPIDALGPLADVARAIAGGGQVRPAVAAQSVLAVAALLAQGRANVRSLEAVKPLSSYFLTIAESGDGKTTSDTIAQKAVQDKQRDDARRFARDLGDFEAASKKDKPEMPREPYRVARDGTVEGIRRSFAMGTPSQAVFSSEAAAMLSGYGMLPDNKAKTAATFNGLFDDGEISVARSGAGRIQLYDRRLSIHWLIQPDAAQATLADPLLSNIGFWPRFLVAWPAPSEPRLARQWRAESDGHIRAFWSRCEAMMAGPVKDDCCGLPVLEPTDEAMTLLGRFFERMEQAAKGPGAALVSIKPFAVRAAELAVRLAGVLAEFEAMPAVDVPTMRGGIALATHSLETWHGIFGTRDDARAASRALLLFGWLLDQAGTAAESTTMLHVGPKGLRSKDARDAALALLEQNGLVYREGAKWTVEA